MNDDRHFHATINATLAHCYDQLEDAYERGDIEEIELNEGVLTITTPHGKTFVVSKHGPSQQLWLASPISGGLHFSYDTGMKRWQLADGTVFNDLLRAELAQLSIAVVL